MSLLSFHRVLIATAIVFCVGYGLWELFAYFEQGSRRSLLLALLFGMGGLALGYYLRNLSRILRIADDQEDPANREGS